MWSSLLQRETFINFNDEENVARIWSVSPVFQRHMKQLGIAPVAESHRDKNLYACSYIVDLNYIQVRPPRRRTLSFEQRAKLAEEARVRFSKKNKK